MQEFMATSNEQLCKTHSQAQLAERRLAMLFALLFNLVLMVNMGLSSLRRVESILSRLVPDGQLLVTRASDAHVQLDWLTDNRAQSAGRKHPAMSDGSLKTLWGPARDFSSTVGSSWHSSVPELLMFIVVRNGHLRFASPMALQDLLAPYPKNGKGVAGHLPSLAISKLANMWIVNSTTLSRYTTEKRMVCAGS